MEMIVRHQISKVMIGSIIQNVSDANYPFKNLRFIICPSRRDRKIDGRIIMEFRLATKKGTRNFTFCMLRDDIPINRDVIICK